MTVWVVSFLFFFKWRKLKVYEPVYFLVLYQFYASCKQLLPLTQNVGEEDVAERVAPVACRVKQMRRVEHEGVSSETYAVLRSVEPRSAKPRRPLLIIHDHVAA